MLSIIIPIYNQIDMTLECIESIRENTPPCEIIIVDNGSDPPFKAPFSGYTEIKVIRNDENKGFPVAVNQGIKEARGEVIVLLNNDTVVTPGWADKLVNALEDFDIVGPITNYCAGMQLVAINGYKNIDELNQAATEWAEENEGVTVEVRWLIGFCMAFKKTLWDKVGPLDESLWPCCGEEIDFCFKAREAGGNVGIIVDCYVHHHGSKTFEDMNGDKQIDYVEIIRANDAHLAEKWGSDFWIRQEIR